MPDLIAQHSAEPSKIRKFLALAPQERRLLVQAAVMLPATKVGLRVAGFRRCYAWLSRLTPPVREDERGSPDVDSRIDRARRVLEIVIEHGPEEGNCLSRSMLLWWLLRRQAVESELRIGVRTAHGELQAHAWVEHRGKPLNEDDNVRTRYETFDRAFRPW